jgi:callose synthase
MFLLQGMLHRKHHYGKTSFVEHRTFLHLYHSFHRLWMFLIMMFQVNYSFLQWPQYPALGAA